MHAFSTKTMNRIYIHNTSITLCINQPAMHHMPLFYFWQISDIWCSYCSLEIIWLWLSMDWSLWSSRWCLKFLMKASAQTLMSSVPFFSAFLSFFSSFGKSSCFMFFMFFLPIVIASVSVVALQYLLNGIDVL